MNPAALRFAELINAAAADQHLGLLCALVASAIDHSADVDSIIVGLDQLAATCPASFDGIVDTLFSSGMFAGDSDDYHHPRNSLLHEVLARRTGMPITLSVVAIEVGQRLGVPILGVGLPGHFVIRDKQSGTFADPFGRGLRYDEAGMISSWQQRMGNDAGPRPSMLAPTGAREIVLRILNNLKQSLVNRNEPVLLARLAPLRAAFPELADERGEHRRWMRHFN
ncbi:MAG: transglutaminase-like domain-containing protein [Actinomycetota bacterium]|nr:transglutaminase-like domain-containing protein [Actinomycetota bacterium]